MNRREKIEEAKEIIANMKSSNNRLIAAKLAVKFGGNASEYEGLVRQAKKELKYAKVAEEAFLLHLQGGGNWHRNVSKFAGLVQMGRAKPECPFPALRREAETVLSSWKKEAENVKSKAWRAMVNLAKSAVESRDEPAEILRVTYPQDNPLLQQKVIAVANRELKNDNYQFTMADVHVDKRKDSGSGRRKKRDAKRKKLALCQQNVSKIFGLHRVV